MVRYYANDFAKYTFEDSNTMKLLDVQLIFLKIKK